MARKFHLLEGEQPPSATDAGELVQRASVTNLRSPFTVASPSSRPGMLREPKWGVIIGRYRARMNPLECLI